MFLGQKREPGVLVLSYLSARLIFQIPIYFFFRKRSSEWL